MEKEQRRRIFIIGLDGGTWTLLKGHMDSGFMPTLKEITDRSSWGILQSTIPPITPVAWTTLQTGVNPAKHGIPEFVRFVWKEEPVVNLVNRSNVKVKTLWEILGESGRKIVVAFLPMTYPPYEVNGALITGLMTPGRKVVYTYPPDLTQKLRKNDIYPLSGWDITKLHNSRSKSEYKKNLNLMIQSVDRVERSMEILDSMYPDWDLFFLQIQSMDVVQHFLWGFMDPDHPFYDSSMATYIGSTYFNRVDQVIQKAIKLFGDERTLFLVISDHGFRGFQWVVNFGNLLVELGYTVLRKLPIKTWLLTFSRVMLRKVDFLKLRRRFISDKVRQELGQEAASASLKMSIDWRRSNMASIGKGTNCYAPVFINPNFHGTFNIKDKFWEDLSNFENKSNIGDKIFQGMLKKNEIYKGPYMDLMPDFVVLPTKNIAFRIGIKKGAHVIESLNENRDLTGIHAPEGIFVATGKKVRRLSGVVKNIVDIPATVLWYLGIPIPKEYDGNPIREIFENEEKERKIKYSDKSIFKEEEGVSLSEEEQKELEKKLRGIGYIG